MRIGIDLNDVVRAYSEQISYIYNKYYCESESDTPHDLMETPFKSFHFQDFLENIKDSTHFKDFLYVEAPQEIFGFADIIEENLDVFINRFVEDVIDEEEHELIFLDKGIGKSIPATFFFLAKTTISANNFKTVRSDEAYWEHCDVLITANPNTLNCKPSDKISIKINQPYNLDSLCDYDYNNLVSVIKNYETIENLINEYE